MKQKILCSLILSSFVFFACSSNDSAGGAEQALDNFNNSNATLWRTLAEEGVPEYFEAAAEEGKFDISSSTPSKIRCESPALKMDDNTRYFDELETIYQEGELVEGVCGKALLLRDGEVAPLGVNLIDSMKAGTVEFWFRPGEDFYDVSARTLLGNDGARVHFFYKNGELFFQKNHADIHYFVNGAVTFENDWNLVAGQWGDGYMSLWVNGKMVARMKHEHGYVPAMRNKPFENLLVIGFKSYCCMEGPGQYEGMTTSGAFDQFRISNIPRYSMENVDDGEEIVVETDTLDVVPPTEDPLDDDSVDVNVDTPATSPEDSTVLVDKDSSVTDSSVSLWQNFDFLGVAAYFNNAEAPVASTYPGKCESPALAMDDNTLFMDELETIYLEGELVDGVCGKAVSLKDGEVAPLGINMIEPMAAGTVEFWFRPGSDFTNKPARTLLGNDGSRVQFLYQNGQLVFQKNHADIHYFVRGEAALDSGWNLIAGQWGDGYMSVWLNDKEVARVQHAEGYLPANRDIPFENLLVIGYKSYCCMEGVGLSEALTTSGAYDQLRISNIPRYSISE
ncbi:MAG: hypothetical protein II892_02910 [Fibrobacter sp.]|nr:hypothetical protein [Fibrobacter sp.]MBQ3780064.1 hypothetical protein [Fibrobacter sp.]